MAFLVALNNFPINSAMNVQALELVLPSNFDWEMFGGKNHKAWFG